MRYNEYDSRLMTNILKYSEKHLSRIIRKKIDNYKNHKCICGVHLEHLYFYYNKNKNIVEIIGQTCFQRSIKNIKIKCENFPCKNIHSNNSGFCLECKNGICRRCFIKKKNQKNKLCEKCSKIKNGPTRANVNFLKNILTENPPDKIYFNICYKNKYIYEYFNDMIWCPENKKWYINYDISIDIKKILDIYKCTMNKEYEVPMYFLNKEIVHMDYFKKYNFCYHEYDDVNNDNYLMANNIYSWCVLYCANNYKSPYVSL